MNKASLAILIALCCIGECNTELKKVLQANFIVLTACAKAMVPQDIDKRNWKETTKDQDFAADDSIPEPAVKKFIFRRATYSEVLLTTTLLLLTFYIVIYCLLFFIGTLTTFDEDEPIEPTWGQSHRPEPVNPFFWYSIV